MSLNIILFSIIIIIFIHIINIRSNEFSLQNLINNNNNNINTWNTAKRKLPQEKDIPDQIYIEDHNIIFDKWEPKNPPIVDFVIRTFHGDYSYLMYMLRSFEKFVSPNIYRQIIITFPDNEIKLFESLNYFNMKIKLVPFNDPPSITQGLYGGGYYKQMYAKYLVYQFSDADYFCHLDSDLFIKAPILSIKLFYDEKGRVPIFPVEYATMPKKGFLKWKYSAQYMLHLNNVTHEMMSVFPFTYPRDLYTNTIRHIEKVHNKTLLNVFEEGYAINEFTVLGTFLRIYMPDRCFFRLREHPDSMKYIQAFSHQKMSSLTQSYYECVIRRTDYQNCTVYEDVHGKNKVHLTYDPLPFS